MCVVHKPHIPDPSKDPEQQKPLPILRNPMLDGLLGNIAAMRDGRNSLRIPLNPLGIPLGGGIGNGGATGGSPSGGSSSSSSGGSISGSGGGTFNGGSSNTGVGITGQSASIN